MMKDLVKYRSKLITVFIVILLVILGNLALVLKAIQASSLFSSSRLQAATPTPTSYRSDLQTLDAALYQTQQAAALTPFPTGTVWSFRSSTETPGPEDHTPVPVTPNTQGAIVDYADPSFGKMVGMNFLNAWSIDADNKHINVYAGSAYSDDTQGMVYVSIFTFDGIELRDGGVYPTPNRSGAVHIVTAHNQRLTLLSTGGETFYFDVPSQRFVASLSDVVPTATSWPTFTSTPSLTPTLNGDAPHNPNAITGLSPINTPLHFIIHNAGDEHWFRFNVPITGTVQVHLDNLPANYDLYVYRVSSASNSGMSTTDPVFGC